MGRGTEFIPGLDETRQTVRAPEQTGARGAPAGKDAKHHDGHRDRLRERFAEAGASALADYELLEII